MKKFFSNMILVLVLFAGVALLLYPSVSNYWNSLHATQAIVDYSKQAANLDHEKYDEMWQQAVEYNKELKHRENPYLLSDEQKAQYETLLELTGTGIMGYIEIESLDVSLPVYHGTSEAVLQVAVGHLDWTSLPTGGEGTHCVLSGHRGLPSAKLFTELDKLVVGDVFVLRILDEILTYEVDQILIVDPDDTRALLLEDGKDLCTLVTCTPYGINTHRLLVRGHRIENAEEAKLVRVTSDAVQIEPLLVAPVVAAPILLILLVYLFASDPGTKGGKKRGSKKKRG